MKHNKHHEKTFKSDGTSYVNENLPRPLSLSLLPLFFIAGVQNFFIRLLLVKHVLRVPFSAMLYK
jgi:hypothetical protein